MMRPSGMLCAFGAGAEHITSFCGKAAKHHCSQSELHHLPTGQTSLFPDVWYTNVLLAPICDKKPTEVRNDPCLSRFFINCHLGHLAKAAV
jgi:hypothetical protein